MKQRPSLLTVASRAAMQAFSLLLALLLSGLVACKQTKKQQHSTSAPSIQNSETVSDPEEPLPLFPAPSIPQMLTTPEDRSIYYVTHFWDSWNLADSALYHQEDRLEQSLANFLSILAASPVSEDQAKQLVLFPLQHTSQPFIAESMLLMYQKYLYEPNSPMVNYELFLPIARWGAKSEWLSIATQERCKDAAQLLSQNRVGQQATDFLYITPEETNGRLSSLRGKHVLLFFYVPDCPICSQEIEALKEDSFLTQQIKQGQLTLLFVFASFGENEWRASLSYLPSWGIKAYNINDTILHHSLYDLRATPALYLLDPRGNVLLRDQPTAAVSGYLRNI